jgi:phosphoglucosamine mutase
MRLRFGTDGIRGVANAELGGELALALGRAAARALSARRFLVGRDTRRSGPLLQAALSAGMASEGADVVDVGVLPTPGVAWLAAERGCPAAVVSASHNLFADNGIKLFAGGGLKLTDALEESVERELESILDGAASPARRPVGHGVGMLTTEPGAAAGYVDHLAGILHGRDLAAMRVVVDCANGAASAVAPAVLERLGVKVTAIAHEPDGANINDGCGSTHPERLADEVVARGAEVGLALDGDADRLLAVDHTGALVDGDALLALFAADLAARGELPGNAVVVTVLTNLGFRLAMQQRGIAVRETHVGDRYVLEALDGDGLVLGGEQSGHIVFRDRATTGDGIMTGVLLLDLVRRAGVPLAEMAHAAMRRLPQVQMNVKAPRPMVAVDAAGVQAELAAVQAELGAGGRVVLRASGTEPMVRVMVEADDEEAARRAAGRLSDAVRRELESRGPPGAAADPQAGRDVPA